MKRFTSFLFVLIFSACTLESNEKHFILAEKFWEKGDYAAAVSEFEKVIKRDKAGRLGAQALFRAAMTQTLFLSEHSQAVEKLRIYVESVGDTPNSWQAQKQIGEIYYSQVKDYQ